SQCVTKAGNHQDNPDCCDTRKAEPRKEKCERLGIHIFLSAQRAKSEFFAATRKYSAFSGSMILLSFDQSGNLASTLSTPSGQDQVFLLDSA
ncbi:MAG: hypothetical protein R6V03_05430, partial [Kiritimatiellia bacterium]